MLQIGVDLGGHTLLVALVEADEVPTGAPARIVKKVETPTPQGRDFERVTDEIARLCAQLSEGRPIPVGVAVPAMLDASRQRLLRLPNFPNWEGAPFLEVVARKLAALGMPSEVAMENDANCYAVGEGVAGVAQNCDDYALFTLGTGIGGGVVLGGHLLTGSHGMAAELGHMALFSTLACGCGGKGHFESVASADALERRAAKEGLPADFKQLWARREEETVREILDVGMDALARAIASVMHALDPQMVILGGGMSRAKGLKKEAEARTLPYLASPFRETLRIAPSTLGNDAALFGAALMRRMSRRRG